MTQYPVFTIATIAGLLTAMGTALISIGQGVDPLVAIGTAIISAGVVIGGGALASTQVTPVSNPHDNAGQPLVPIDQADGSLELEQATILAVIRQQEHRARLEGPR